MACSHPVQSFLWEQSKTLLMPISMGTSFPSSWNSRILSKVLFLEGGGSSIFGELFCRANNLRRVPGEIVIFLIGLEPCDKLRFLRRAFDVSTAVAAFRDFRGDGVPFPPSSFSRNDLWRREAISVFGRLFPKSIRDPKLSSGFLCLFPDMFPTKLPTHWKYTYLILMQHSDHLLKGA